MRGNHPCTEYRMTGDRAEGKTLGNPCFWKIWEEADSIQDLENSPQFKERGHDQCGELCSWSKELQSKSRSQDLVIMCLVAFDVQ